MRALSIAALLLFCPAIFRLAPAQTQEPDDLSAGKLLVADKELSDPNFARTVVLLVKYDDDGVIGLILNRRSKSSMASVLDDVKAARHREDPVYAGGPVSEDAVLALLRADDAPDDAQRVAGDIYLVTSKDLLEKALPGATDATLRVYVGYAGWGIGQLEDEVDEGAWHIFRSDAKLVFDADPESLWPRMIRETELHVASVFDEPCFRAPWMARCK